MLPTWSRLAPLRRATWSSLLISSMLAPVASTKSFMASRPLMMARVHCTTALMLNAPAKTPPSLLNAPAMPCAVRSAMAWALFIWR